MVDIFARNLDAWLGKHRNSISDTKAPNEHFSNPNVCKYALVSFCPHELFPNTKFDMGPCEYRHDELFKKQFILLNDQERNPYEKKYIDETIAAYQKQIDQIDVKIKKAMAKTENPTNKYDRVPSEIQEKIDNIELEIKRFIQQAEYLGEMGRIEESERVNEEIQKLRSTKEDLRTLAENPTLIAKQMKVCEICGAMQATNDTEKRNQTHLEGKVHTGFSKLRNELEKLKRRREILKIESKANAKGQQKKEETKRVEEKAEQLRREHQDHKERNERKKEKDRKRSRDRSKDRHRSKEREKHKDRSKSKEKEKRRHREEEDSDKGRSRSRTRDDKKKKHKKEKEKDKRSKRSRS